MLKIYLDYFFIFLFTIQENLYYQVQWTKKITKKLKAHEKKEQIQIKRKIQITKIESTKQTTQTIKITN